MRGVSLRIRLALVVVLILLGGVLTSGLLAYRSARREAVNAAHLRQINAAAKLAETAAPGLAAGLAAIDSLARSPDLALALRRSDTGEATRRLLAPIAPSGRTMAALVLRDLEGRAVLTLGEPPARAVLQAPQEAEVGPIFTADTSLYFELAAPVRSADTVVGHLVQVRRILGSQAAVDLLTGLIGSGATLLVGNVDGSLWSDFERVIERPPPSFKGSAYTRDREARIAGSARIAGTPLALSVEMPESQALASVRSLFRDDAVVATVVVLLGTLVAWWMAGTLAAPITTLTRAAEVVARGENVQAPLPTGRGDELGRLARAFETMADKVRQGRETLEQRVSDRTEELATALRRLETAQEELVRRERLATLGQLSSSVGHELRNPLGVMTNAVYFLTATQPDATPKTKEYLELIRNQIRIAEKIVADLLDFARVRPPQWASVTLDAFLDGQLERVTQRPGVEVVRDLSAGLPPVRVDPVQIGQVVLNLVTNAVQAMEEEGGVLTIAAHHANGKVALEFADTGPGIAKENLERVFEPLFTTKARGIGLGLSVSRTLARANGGELTARNGADRGAVFVLDLPVDSPA
ncbi:MAG: ATP-binding protein [Gemmatimonadales bacterium]